MDPAGPRFLRARGAGVDAAALASSGGWPALAGFTATAGADLVLDYLWEEVLTCRERAVISWPGSRLPAAVTTTSLSAARGPA